MKRLFVALPCALAALLLADLADLIIRIADWLTDRAARANTSMLRQGSAEPPLGTSSDADDGQ